MKRLINMRKLSLAEGQIRWLVSGGNESTAGERESDDYVS